VIVKHSAKTIAVISVAVISMVINIVLACLLAQTLIVDNSVDNIVQSAKDIAQSTEDERISQLSLEDYYEQQTYTREAPLFYGTWRIVEVIPTEFAQPSFISGFYQNEEGEIIFRGPDTSTVIGMEITFALDYAEYAGEKHEYMSRPRTNSYPLLEDTRIISNYAKILGITGDHYSVVHFLLPSHDRRGGAGPREVKMSDMREVYLKDRDTMYADFYDGINYRLERVYPTADE